MDDLTAGEVVVGVGEDLVRPLPPQLTSSISPSSAWITSLPLPPSKVSGPSPPVSMSPWVPPIRLSVPFAVVTVSRETPPSTLTSTPLGVVIASPRSPPLRPNSVTVALEHRTRFTASWSQPAPASIGAALSLISSRRLAAYRGLRAIDRTTTGSSSPNTASPFDSIIDSSLRPTAAMRSASSSVTMNRL